MPFGNNSLICQRDGLVFTPGKKFLTCLLYTCTVYYLYTGLFAFVRAKSAYLFICPHFIWQHFHLLNKFECKSRKWICPFVVVIAIKRYLEPDGKFYDLPSKLMRLLLLQYTFVFVKRLSTSKFFKITVCEHENSRCFLIVRWFCWE